VVGVLASGVEVSEPPPVVVVVSPPAWGSLEPPPDPSTRNIRNAKRKRETKAMSRAR
jgi:hypothetical protein